jgi:hypothetical protein
MLALPWKSFRTPATGEELLAMVSYLPLKRFRRTPRFFGHVRAIQGQLQRAEGLVGYSLRAKLFKRDYWTLSVWNDEASLMRFVRNLPHGDVMRSLSGDMGSTQFVRWRLSGSATPPRWDDALRRLVADRSQSI